ncbi:MAG: hypothetical protein R3D98_06020 [Candidatus Krumholzibacteriia bacterium]
MNRRYLNSLTCCAVGLLLAGCGGHIEDPMSPVPDRPAEGAIKRSGAPDQAFLADLQQAFDTTTWERVQFSEVTRGGARIARPKSWAVGEYLQVSVLLRDPSLRDVPLVEVYVPASEQSTPGHCVLFEFDGLVAGAEYVVQTFLPAWFDDLDLGPYHHTFELAYDPATGLYEALWLTRFDTPPTPWAHPPVTFTLLPMDPQVAERARWVAEPGGDGDG